MIKNNIGYGGLPFVVFVLITFIPGLTENMSLMVMPVLSLIALIALLLGLIFIKTQTISSKILLAVSGLLILLIWVMQV